jgi:outer membrane receptor for ferrienterochelin and colicins
MTRISKYFALLILFSIFNINFAQSSATANLIGHVTHNGEHVKYANIIVKGTTLGTATGENGHYQLFNIPTGEITVIAQAVGYKPSEVTVNLDPNETKEIKFELPRDVLGMEEVVVTGNRNEVKRKESTTIVKTLNPEMFEKTQSHNLCETLNYTPGLRTENNCQNCGFTQVRMNGLEGPYSQILINSRPIFSGLAGVYGLELIPSNIIEKVEVIRGGGSALYGSNAIAGTINLILKDPILNSYELKTTSGLIGVGQNGSGGTAPDNTVTFNSSLVTDNQKTGVTVYGYYRNRNHFDANNDNFSEIGRIENTTLGGRAFHKISKKDKITLDFFHIKEDRRGGNDFNEAFHQSDITEAAGHNLLTGALTYEHFYSNGNLLSIFASGQRVKRDSYYGAAQSLSDYGETNDFTYSLGAQYDIEFDNSKLLLGVENNASWMKDEKLGYPDYENAVVENGEIVEIPHKENLTVADQSINTFGAFTQYEFNLNKLKVSLGGRFDRYHVEDKQHFGSDKAGNVFSPRLNLLYDIKSYLQGRISYAQGYRAPQIFDEDLHIETSGSRKVLHENDPDLTQETSHSIMASLDFNKQINSTSLGFLVEAFYTNLTDPFANEFSEPNDNGTVVYTRVNADEGAVVKGVNLELNLVPSYEVTIQSGFTYQTSEYGEAQEFNEKRFFRTPDTYGYFAMDWQASEKLGLSTTGNYTGSMILPYFGTDLANPEQGELRETGTFFDLGFKVRYNIELAGTTVQLFTGIQNILNSYQDDFDRGIDRDPGYIYGPMNPRTISFGLKVGNLLK